MRFVPGFRTTLPPQIQWQPTLTSHDPNPPIPINEGSVTNYTLDIDLGTYTLTGNSLELVPVLVMAVDAGSYTITGQDPELELVQGVSGAVAAHLPTGSGRKKSLPYGWWNESAAPEQELKTAERAIKAAQAEVKTDKAIQSATVDRLRSALWFAQVDAQILRLEQIAQAEQAKALRALARQVQIEKARLAAELEDEEEIELLLLSSL